MGYTNKQYLNVHDRKSKGATAQLVVIIVTVALILLLLLIPVLEGLLLISMIKKYADKACAYSVVVNMLLTRQAEEVFKQLCSIYGGGESGGAGSSGDFECYGGDLNKDSLIKQLAADEGGARDGRYYLYQDSAGKLTIGIGHNLEGGNDANFKTVVGQDVSVFTSHSECRLSLNESSQITTCPSITEQQAQDLLTQDLKYSEDTIRSKITSYDSLPGTAKQIVVEMFFQMGIGGLNEHTKMITALNSKGWKEAAAEIIDSARYTQLHCENSAPEIATATEAADKFRTTYPDESWITSGSCRVLRQATRMGMLTGNGVCTTPTVKESGNRKDYKTIIPPENIGPNAELNFDISFGDRLVSAIAAAKAQGIKITIVSGTDGDHTPTSNHYKGIAADINAVYVGNDSNSPYKGRGQLCFQDISKNKDAGNNDDGSCDDIVKSLLGANGIYNKICYKNVSGFGTENSDGTYKNDGDCNHFSLSGT